MPQIAEYIDGKISSRPKTFHTTYLSIEPITSVDVGYGVFGPKFIEVDCSTKGVHYFDRLPNGSMYSAKNYPIDERKTLRFYEGDGAPLLFPLGFAVLTAFGSMAIIMEKNLINNGLEGGVL